MPIYKGSQEIKHIYKGNEKILAVYKGGTRVYPEGDGCFIWTNTGYWWANGTTTNLVKVALSTTGQNQYGPIFNWDYTYIQAQAPSGTWIDNDTNGGLAFRISASTAGTWLIHGTCEVRRPIAGFVSIATAAPNVNSPFLVNDYMSTSIEVAANVWTPMEWAHTVTKPANTKDAHNNATDWRMYPGFLWQRYSEETYIRKMSVGITRTA